MTVSIIGAKKSSKRLPGKNTKIFCGHPLVAWTIVQSINSTLINETYVSTDCEEIAEISEKYGAKIVWRDYEQQPEEGVSIPIIHAIEKLKLGDNDLVATPLVTSPARFPDDIDNMIRTWEPSHDIVIGYLAPQEETVIYRKMDDHLASVVIFNKDGSYLTQGGGTGLQTVKWLRRKTEPDEPRNAEEKAYLANYMPGKIWQQFDIDYPDEFELVELLMNYYILQGRGIEIYEEYYKREIERMDRCDKEPA